MTLEQALAQVYSEVKEAKEAYPRFHSAHEGYAILAEEVDELWAHVKVKQGKRDIVAMRKEAVQVAAMAVRFLLECGQK